MGRAKKVEEATSLELVVYDRKDGVLRTNADAILAFVDKKLVKYTTKEYTEENLAEAKKDKAELNSAVSVLNSRRLILEREFMEPFSGFKDTINTVCSRIKEVSNKIDTVVKKAEQEEKDRKRKLIEEEFAKRQFNLVPLEKIFNERWLNKGTTMVTVSEELDTAINTINSELEDLEPFGIEARGFYLETLDLGKAIFKATELRKAEERLGEVEELKVEPIKLQPEDKMIPISVFGEDSSKEVLTRTIKVIGTLEQLMGLTEYLNSSGIKFRKVEA